MSIWFALIAFVSLGTLQDIPAERDAVSEEPDNRIVIQGQQIQEEDFRKLLSRISPVSLPDRPLDRLIEPLCLAVSGANERQGRAIVALVEVRAGDFDVEIAGEGCRPNALVIIHDDLSTIITGLSQTQPGLFVDHASDRLIGQLGTQSSSVVWSNTETRGVDGQRLPETSAIAGSTLPLPVSTKMNSRASARRIGLNLSSAIVNVVAIIDPAALDGISIATLSDYLTLRLLAPSLIPSQLRATDPPSLLGLLEIGASGPDALTVFDRAYLSALYSLPLNASSNRLRGAMIKALASDED